MLVQQALPAVQLSRPVADPRVNQPPDGSLFPSTLGDDLGVETFRYLGRFPVQAERIGKGGVLREEPVDQVQHDGHRFLQRVNDGVGTGIERVGGDGLACGPVQLFDDPDDTAGDVVEVKDGRFRVQADGVERVGIPHRGLGKRFEIPRLDRLGNVIHPAGDDLFDPMLQQRTRLHRPLHSTRRARPFFSITDDADQGVHLGPVGTGSDLFRQRVGTVFLGTHTPGDVPAKERTTGRAGSLTGDEGELRGSLGERVELRERGDEGGEARSGRGETRGGGEVVVRGDVDVVL